MTETAAYRTKMIEVGLPLEAINAACKREKSIRHGHPSTLHLYWARRPLAACRAVLFSSLVDDPSADPAYKDKGEEAIQERRQELHDQLAELVLWESTNDEPIINRARAEIASSLASFAAEKGEIDANDWPGVIERTAKPELVNKYLAEVAPPVLDPFAGGGSIPLEAQRLGLRAYASDLNPVAVLINKALIEIPPKFSNQPPINPEAQEDNLGTKTWKGARGLAEDVRYYGKWMRDEAEKRIGHLYPKVKVTQQMVDDGRPDLKPYVGQELTVIAWLWARTVKSPNPAAGEVHVPLLRGYWLAKKKGKEAYIYPEVDAVNGTYRFEVRRGFPQDGFDPNKGTVERTGATCLVTNSPMSFEHVREEGKSGRMRAKLTAIACEGIRERVYISPTKEHERLALETMPDDYPVTPIPEKALGFRVQLYGMDHHYKLFSGRQLNALTLFSDLVTEVSELIDKDVATKGMEGEYSGYGRALATYLTFGISRSADFWSNLCAWAPQAKNELVGHVFGRQALAMVWDYAEANPFSNSGGNFEQNLSYVCKMISTLAQGDFGVAIQKDATESYSLPDKPVVVTDPPYYDNIGYADLSDFFYVWVRRSLETHYPNIASTLLTPKENELIATPHRHGEDRTKAKDFFEEGLGRSIQRMREGANTTYPVSIFYAFKQSETDEAGESSTGWETFLSGILNTGFVITGTWPVRTERDKGLKSGANVLASSIVLVCRPRAVDAGLTTRTDFVRELRTHLGKALADLQQSSIAPVDLQQAAIGPGMAVFSKYVKVLESDGLEMSVRAALGLINQALEEVLSEQEGEFDADTRFATIWFEQFGFDTGDYGTAETLAKAKAISVSGVVEAGILESTGGKVRLLKPEELDEDWKPEDDDRLTVWEVTHYLCRALETGGVDGAADLVRRIGGLADSARDLAYRLFSICDKKKWATEAQPYNALVASWPDIQDAAATEPIAATTDSEGTLFEG